MAVPLNFVYNHVAHLMFTGAFSHASTVKAMLMATTHNDPDKKFVSELNANEINPAAGYVRGYGGSGRKSLGVLTSIADNTTDRTRFTGPSQLVWNASGSLLTLATDVFSMELIVETGGFDATSYLIAHIAALGFPYTIASTTLPFRITLDPNEIFAFLRG